MQGLSHGCRQEEFRISVALRCVVQRRHDGDYAAIPFGDFVPFAKETLYAPWVLTRAEEQLDRLFWISGGMDEWTDHVEWRGARISSAGRWSCPMRAEETHSIG